MAITLSCDDGCASDMRVAALCRKYDIDCVFYWPVEWRSLAYDHGYEPLTLTQAYDIAADFEIGSHTITHRHLTKLTEEEARNEIADSKFMLEDIFGQDINKFCPPRGYTNGELTRYTLNHYESQRLTKGEGLVHIHPNSGANGNVDWREYVKNNHITEAWCHSWELNKYNLWEQLEEFLSENSPS